MFCKEIGLLDKLNFGGVKNLVFLQELFAFVSASLFRFTVVELTTALIIFVMGNKINSRVKLVSAYPRLVVKRKSPVRINGAVGVALVEALIRETS